MRGITDITTTNPTPINIIVDPTTDIVLTPSAIRMAATIDIKRRLTSTHSEAASVGANGLATIPSRSRYIPSHEDERSEVASPRRLKPRPVFPPPSPEALGTLAEVSCFRAAVDSLRMTNGSSEKRQI